jgi:Rieske 2Fe-2S family protein
MSELVGQALTDQTMLPKPAYTSPEWFELERRTVHDRRWTYLGHVSEVESDDAALEPGTVCEWHGLLFRVPDGGLDNADFAPVAKHPHVFERYRLEEAKVVHSEVYDIAANWKAIRENFLECYHCSANHPEFLAAFDLRGQYDDDGRQNDGFPLKNGMCSLSLDGLPVCKRPFGDFADVPVNEWAYTFATAAPDFIVIANPDHVVVFSYLAVSVDRTVLKCDWLVHRNAVEGVDYETKDVVVVWHQTNLQDIALCESAQRGMRSSSFEPGPLSADREPDIFDFHRRYAGWLRDGALEAASR